MSATPLKNLLLVAVVIGFSTIALGNGQIDSVVARAASDFVTASADIGADAPAYLQNEPYGMWSFEFE